MIWVVLAVIALLVIFAILSYNGLIRSRNQVENAWSQIDVQLKRRIDLIPNLVETVKGYAAHEKETLDAVVRARNAAIAATSDPHAQAAADNQMTGALRQLFALSEAYPDLKANQNFLQLQEELSDIENKLAASRRFFNGATTEYNNAVESFPSNLIARNFGFKREIMFDLGEDRRKDMEEPPKVQF